MTLQDVLPFLIPLIIAEAVLQFFSLRHILTHKNYKRGNRVMWVIISIVGFEIIGPVLYFTLGKEE